MSWRALYKLALGFSLGFLGAYVTIQAIDRFAPAAEEEPLEIVLGAPDFDAFCSRDQGRDLRGVTTTGDPYGWQCVGTVGGLWTTEPLEPEDVCRWEHGAGVFARLVTVDDPAGWMCVIPR